MIVKPKKVDAHAGGRRKEARVKPIRESSSNSSGRRGERPAERYSVPSWKYGRVDDEDDAIVKSVKRDGFVRTLSWTSSLSIIANINPEHHVGTRVL